MATVTTADYQSIQQSLGRCLRRLRADCLPMETARLLLTYDEPAQPLVGLRFDGARAVYVHTSTRDVIAVRFDSEGTDDRGGQIIGNLRPDTTIHQWVGKQEAYWGWRHPRYR